MSYCNSIDIHRPFYKPRVCYCKGYMIACVYTQPCLFEYRLLVGRWMDTWKETKKLAIRNMSLVRESHNEHS